MKEFDLIRIVSEFFGNEKVEVPATHHDAAYVKLGEKYIVLTCDTVNELSDFPKYMEPEEMGHMALAVTLSDIAACGAKPLYFLNSISIRDEIYYTKSLIDKEIILDNKLAYYKDELSVQEEFYSYIEVPHIAIDRFHIAQKGVGSLFFTEELSGDARLGFYFLCNCDKIWEKKLTPLFRLLADEGIGGDRSSGKGIMGQPRFDEIDINIPEDGDGVVTLSLYYPADGVELTDIQRGFYKLIERKGYIFSPVCKSFRRKSVRMFTEGSVFSAKPFRKGCLVSVKPQIFTQHEVYRYGYIFTLPCKLEVCGAD